MAYEIVKRLKKAGQTDVLDQLAAGVQVQEGNKGKQHQVFRLSFDAKLVEGEKEINQVLDYIHHNPVSGKWQLVDDFTTFALSSVAYNELGKSGHLKLWDYRNIISASSSAQQPPQE